MFKYLCIFMLVCFGGLSAAESNAALYYHPNCSHCKTVKSYLNQMNMTVPMKNVSNPKYQNELRNLGQKGVPVLVIENKVIGGSTAIINYLKQHPEALSN